MMLFSLALSTRLLYQAAIAGMGTPPRDDALQYDEIGWSLAQGGPFEAGDGYRSHRAPAYPILLASAYAVAGHHVAVARIVQALIGAFTCLLLVPLGERLFSPVVGIAAATGYALFPYAIFWCGGLLSEPLAIFFTVASTWALMRAGAGARGTAAWAFLCGLATLTRPNLALLFGFGLVWVVRRSSRPVRQCGWAILVFGLTLLPWTARNYHVHGRLVPVTTMGGIVLWEGNNPYVMRNPDLRGRSVHAADLPEAKQARGLSEVDLDAFYGRLAIAFMREHASDMPGLIFQKFMRLWNPFPSLPSVAERGTAFASMAPLLLLFVAGLVMGSVSRNVNVVPLLVPVLAVIVTGTVYWADARIRAPADPAIMLIAAYGAYSLWSRLKPVQRAAVGPCQSTGGTLV